MRGTAYNHRYEALVPRLGILQYDLCVFPIAYTESSIRLFTKKLCEITFRLRSSLLPKYTCVSIIL